MQWLTFGLLLIYSVQFAFAKTIGLNDLWNSCQTNSTQLHILRETIKQAENQVLTSKSYLYPEIVVSGLMQQNGNLPQIQLGNRTMQFQPDQTYRGSIQTNYSLYNGRRTKYSIQSQLLQSDLTQNQYHFTENQLAYDVSKAYWSWVFAFSAEKIAVKKVELARQYFFLVDSMFQMGLASKLDLSQAKLNYEQQQVSLDNARMNKKMAAMAIESLTKYKIFDEDVPKNELYDTTFVVKPDTILEKALSQRLEIKSQKLRIRLSEIQIHIHQANLFPQLTLFGNYSIANGVDPFDAMKFRDQWTVGLQMVYPLFQGFRTKWEMETSKHFQRQQQFQLEQIEDQIEKEVYLYFVKVSNSNKILSFQNAAVQHARDVWTTVLAKYESGQASSFEVQEALTQLATTELNQVQLFYDFQVALLDYYKLTGNMLTYLERFTQ